MATFSFDRPLVLDEKSAEKFFEIALTPAKPDGIKPYSYEEQKESEEIIKKWFENQRKKR
ncbi:MAG: hypothetical protein HDT43_01895 [Ruminococcaceae bacterium]|nr:hypothetical protein [Oscillospiraceae bacterium]